MLGRMLPACAHVAAMDVGALEVRGILLVIQDDRGLDSSEAIPLLKRKRADSHQGAGALNKNNDLRIWAIWIWSIRLPIIA